MEIFIRWFPGRSWLPTPTCTPPGEAATGYDGVGAWRSRGKPDSGREPWRELEQDFLPFEPTWAEAMNVVGPGLYISIQERVPLLPGVWGEAEPGETVELRVFLPPGVLIGTRYMQLLTGLLSLKEYREAGSELQRTDTTVLKGPQ